MLAPQALIKGIVNRLLPPRNIDGVSTDIPVRMHSYGEPYVMPVMRKQHVLADEGSYFLFNAGQTGITPPLGVAFSATVAALVIYNNDLQLGRSLFLDYIALTNIVAVTATSATAGAPNFCALTIDNGNRYSSGGTALNAPVSPNMGAASSTPAVLGYFGNITAAAASPAARTIVGQRVTRPNASTSAITVVGDQLFFNFGGVEGLQAGNITITNPNLIPIPMPPVIISPNQSAVLHLWWVNSTPAGGASGFLPEVGFWMR